ncbi:MAG: mechanosensitive ion channel family protein, partial [Sedimentisphaerales bacterium]|nr:mechanosensitive ion channel family protein [Sedimentisphaerales bacterium]
MLGQINGFQWADIGWFLLAAAAAAAAGALASVLLYAVGSRLARRTRSIVDDLLFRHASRPAGVILIMLVLLVTGRVAQEILATPAGFYEGFRHLLVIWFIVAVAWLSIKLSRVLNDFIVHQFDVEAKDNLQARKIHTQLRVFNRVVFAVVCVLAFALILMTFERIRTLGTSILASAGVIGIIVGFAAQRSIATLIAGM